MDNEGRMHYGDLQAGDEFVSQGRTVTEADVVNFSGLSGDFNPLHVDAEYGRNKTIFGKNIAHGLLGAAIMSGLGSVSPSLAEAGYVNIDWRFSAPIFFGDTVVLYNKVAEKLPLEGNAGKVVFERKLKNQKGEVVQEGKITILVKL